MSGTQNTDVNERNAYVLTIMATVVTMTMAMSVAMPTSTVIAVMVVTAAPIATTSLNIDRAWRHIDRGWRDKHAWQTDIDTNIDMRHCRACCHHYCGAGHHSCRNGEIFFHYCLF